MANKKITNPQLQRRPIIAYLQERDRSRLGELLDFYDFDTVSKLLEGMIRSAIDRMDTPVNT